MELTEVVNVHMLLVVVIHHNAYDIFMIACISSYQRSKAAACRELSLDLSPIYTFTIIISRYIVAFTIIPQEEPTPITMLSLEWVLKSYSTRR